jgi:hypothetical protein
MSSRVKEVRDGPKAGPGRWKHDEERKIRPALELAGDARRFSVWWEGTGIPAAVPTQARTPSTTSPLGSAEDVSGRALSRSLTILGLVGLLLLVGGGAFQWPTRGQGRPERTPFTWVKLPGDGQARDAPKPDGNGGRDREISLDELLAGIKDWEPLNTARWGITRARARRGSSGVSREPLPVANLPYDWQSFDALWYAHSGWALFQRRDPDLPLV